MESEAGAVLGVWCALVDFLMKIPYGFFNEVIIYNRVFWFEWILVAIFTGQVANQTRFIIDWQGVGVSVLTL